MKVLLQGIISFFWKFGLHMALPLIYGGYAIWAGYELIAYLFLHWSIDHHRLLWLFYVGIGYHLITFLTSHYDLVNLNEGNMRAEVLRSARATTIFSAVLIALITFALNSLANSLQAINFNEMAVFSLGSMFIGMTVSMLLIHEAAKLQAEKIYGMK